MRKIFTLFFALSAAFSSLFAADLTVTGSFPSNNWVNNAADYKMLEIGTTGIYSLEKLLVAGSYEFKVFYTGTWDGANGDFNAKFTLSEDKIVKFYAKDNGSSISFICDAQEFYIIGDVVGGWSSANAKAMVKTTTDAKYIGDIVAGNYKLITMNGANVVWNFITPLNQSLSGSGNYTITLDFQTLLLSVSNSTSTDLTPIQNDIRFLNKKDELCLCFNGLAIVELYSIDGQFITNTKAINEFNYKLNSGIYILRLNGISHKVVIQ